MCRKKYYPSYRLTSPIFLNKIDPKFEEEYNHLIANGKSEVSLGIISIFSDKIFYSKKPKFLFNYRYHG